MNISNLQKSAINFLYIFVAENATVSDQIKHKRAMQIEQLSDIYRKNIGYTFRELVQIVDSGIRQRYGQSPEELLQSIYSVAAKPAGIGALDDVQSAQAVENISMTVADENGTKKKNIWKDVKDVIEWIVDLLLKIFGTYKNPNIYSPSSDDWTYANRPKLTESGTGIVTVIPVLATAGIVYFLWKSPNGKKTEKRKK